LGRTGWWFAGRGKPSSRRIMETPRLQMTMAGAAASPHRRIGLSLLHQLPSCLINCIHPVPVNDAVQRHCITSFAEASVALDQRRSSTTLTSSDPLRSPRSPVSGNTRRFPRTPEAEAPWRRIQVSLFSLTLSALGRVSLSYGVLDLRSSLLAPVARRGGGERGAKGRKCIFEFRTC
jgi:hypothetical protein